ncbi:MAG TPA: aspartyl-phosphate phosphatase Spo0E family protein [Metabacillus sp.]|nr:aspartyl-phosphate phosphatase Spo0E family protein [Metabacillus sp.]
MLDNEIEFKRQGLIKTALQYGINSNITIQCSQELDLILLQEIKELNKQWIEENPPQTLK